MFHVTERLVPQRQVRFRPMCDHSHSVRTMATQLASRPVAIRQRYRMRTVTGCQCSRPESRRSRTRRTASRLM